MYCEKFNIVCNNVRMRGRYSYVRDSKNEIDKNVFDTALINTTEFLTGEIYALPFSDLCAKCDLVLSKMKEENFDALLTQNGFILKKILIDDITALTPCDKKKANELPFGSLNVWRCVCSSQNSGNFCPRCGNRRPYSQSNCTCCGSPLAQDAKFCQNCGKSV